MRKYVVIIDDDVDDIEFLRSAIAGIDPSVKCTGFTSPQDALQALSGNEMRMPDVICVDYNMPVLNGIDCLRLFRALNKLNHTTMVANSTCLSKNLERDFRSNGASYVFEKPGTFGGYEKIALNILSNAAVDYTT
jgi:CheY-like chemotaxis protein